MNPTLDQLQAYPFERLTKLLADVTPPADKTMIPLTVGEPQHQPPQFVLDALVENLGSIQKYPATKGLPALRTAISGWLQRRFSVAVDAETQVLPVNGTREALFAFAQSTIDSQANTELDIDKAVVCMPNPCYQIYEGAALLAGAEPHYIPVRESDLLLDIDSVAEDTWQRCQLLYICTPGNPTGAVEPMERLKQIIALADKYDFVIASDECYAEIYPDSANNPISLLNACKALGRDDYKRCVIFHSLSKRSNLPGLRSGFVAGDAELLAGFLKYRTYHGCAMGMPAQHASIAAWNDDQHVEENLVRYQEKFESALAALSPVTEVSAPDASFYLWLKTPICDVKFAKRLYEEQNVKVLPGSFLSREVVSDEGVNNPGKHRVRISLVADTKQCAEATQRIAEFIQHLN